MTMLGHAAPNDFAFQHIKRGEQRGCAVAFVVMRHGSGASLLHRQGGLRAIKPLACQTRCTDALLTPQTSAMLRQLHCVACFGALCVLVIIAASWARASGLKLRPRGRSALRAATPPSATRCRQSITVDREVSSSFANALFDLPPAAPRTIRARRAMR